jgi:hypothetical protein
MKPQIKSGPKDTSKMTIKQRLRELEWETWSLTNDYLYLKKRLDKLSGTKSPV